MPRLSCFGSYVTTQTPVHRIDARAKLVVLLATTIAVFAARSAGALVALTLAIVLMCRLARLSTDDIAKAIQPTAVVLAFSLLANAFVLDGSGDVAIIGPWGVSLAGLSRGFLAVLRIALLVSASLVVSSTTTPPQVSDAAASLLSPLRAFGVPTADIAMILSVAIRFIPICAEEFERIAMAQRSRGAHLDNGSMASRIRAWSSVLTPLVVSLFRRADVLAGAMRDRCYRGRNRTRFPQRMGASGVLVIVCGIGFCICCCLV